MGNINRACANYNTLLNTEYYFVIGRKGKAVEIRLRFSKIEFYHICGLHKLSDIIELNDTNKCRIFDNILNNTISSEMCERSIYYSDAEGRIELIENLEAFLDSNRTVFKFNNRTNSFSLIEADYILKNSDRSRNLYLFISKDKSGTYFCRSAFPRNKAEQDYTVGHTSYTLLYKEKINTADSTKKILYTNPSYTPPESRKPALCK